MNRQSNTIAEQYRRMFHPDLYIQVALPEPEPIQESKFKPETHTFVNIVRSLKGPITAARVYALTGIDTTHLANQIWRAMEKGWLKRTKKGSYLKTNKFPKQLK